MYNSGICPFQRLVGFPNCWNGGFTKFLGLTGLVGQLVVNRIYDFPFVDLIGTRGRFRFNCEHYSFRTPPPPNSILSPIFNRFEKTREMAKSFSVAKTYFPVGRFYWDLRFIKRYGRPFPRRMYWEFAISLYWFFSKYLIVILIKPYKLDLGNWFAMFLWIDIKWISCWNDIYFYMDSSKCGTSLMRRKLLWYQKILVTSKNGATRTGSCNWLNQLLRPSTC